MKTTITCGPKGDLMWGRPGQRELLCLLKSEHQGPLAQEIAERYNRFDGLLSQVEMLTQAVAELLPFAQSAKLTSHKSFDRAEPFTRESVVEFARGVMLATNALHLPAISDNLNQPL